MASHSEEDVLKLYKQYQSTRRKDDEHKQTALPSTQKNDTVTSTVNDDQRTGDTDEVLKLYQSFQRSRNPYREQAINHVMAAVKTTLAQHESITQQQTVYHHTVTKSHWTKALGHAFTNFLSSLHLNQWQTAVAITTILVIAVLIPTITFHEKQPYSIMTVTIPRQLLTHSHVLAETIRPDLNASFAFTSSQSLQQTAFQLGVVSVNLPVLTNVDRQQTLMAILSNSQRLVSVTGNVTLIKTTQTTKAIAASELDHTHKTDAILSYTTSLDNYFIESPSSVAYRLGKWVEITLLSTHVANINNANLLKHMLRQARAFDANALATLALSTEQLTVVNRIHALSYNDTQKSLHKIRKSLRQIKAALS